MKSKILYILILVLSSFCSCQTNEKAKEEPIKNHNNENNDIMKEVMIKQLKAGYKSNYLDRFSYYDYNDDDFKAISLLTDEILLKNGYRKLTIDDFNRKVKNIFNINLNNNTTHFLYNPLDCNFKELGQKAYEPYYYGNFYFILHFDKEKRFMPYEFFIPEIVDYQSKFPELENYDKSNDFINEDGNEDKTFPWKENDNLAKERKHNILLLVNRNLYLFNDDKSKLPWLVKNDTYFMKSLVLTFGWTEDEKLLKWVIDNNKFDENNPLEFANIFYTKKCDGTLKLHSNTFKYLQKTVTPQNDQILEDIKFFVRYFANFNNKIEELSEKERLEILSNIVYFAQQYKYEKGFDNHRIMSWMYFYVRESEEIIKQNNYFNLPKFKQWWDEQYLDGDFDIVTDINDGARDDY